MNTNHSPFVTHKANVARGVVVALVVLLLGSVSTILWTAVQPAESMIQARTLHEALNAPADGVEPLPSGATIETLLPNMNYPIALAFDPNGRLFYTEKVSGAVRLYANGVLQASPVIQFTVSSSSERGLLGITIDPNFSTNHYIYVYLTCDSGGGCSPTQNRVVRFEENNGVGTNPTVVFWSPQTAGNHNGGNIHFGPDGKLYVSVGDNANAANSQDVTSKNGKMHRINGDGTIPNDNPVFTQTGALPSLYAIGLRNSFDFALDPQTPGRIFASENGPGCDDEMNRIEAGWNYGWRSSYPCDDANPSPQYNTIPPLWYLGTGACCEAPTGIEVYSGLQVPQWTNHLFMATYNNQVLRHFYLSTDRTVVTQTNIVQGVSIGTDLETGPDGALWYIQGGGYTTGILKRIVGPGGTPTSTKTPSPTVTGTPPTNTTTSTPAPNTFTSTPTNTPTRTATPTVTRTPTSPPPPTSTFTRTATAIVTSTAIITGSPSPTGVPSSETPVSTETPATNTPIPSSPTATATVCSMSFSDVNPSDYFYESVMYLACNGVISGYADGTFRPYNDTTRGQLTKIVVLAEGWDVDCPTDPHFTDVPPEDPFYCYVETAFSHEIIAGYSDGTFRPGNNVTRGQLCKIIVLAQGWQEECPASGHFTDVLPGSVFYCYVETAYAHQIIGGYSDGTFRPGNNATRGQISKIVYQAVTQP